MTIIRRYGLVFFFVLAFAFTWSRWLPEAAAGRGWLNVDIPFWLVLLAGYGPLLAALLVTALTDGWPGIKDLGARLVRWRVAPRVYLIILLLPVFMQSVGILLHSLVTGRPIVLAPDRQPWIELLSFFPLLFLGFDGIGEEVGWRGFALPRLLARHSPLIASLILGIIWGVWHLAYALAPGGFLSETPFYYVVANTIGLSILHTWIFAQARGSIFTAILFHAWNNTLSLFLANWLPITSQPGANLSNLLVQYSVVAAVLMFAYPFRLLRKRIPRPEEAQI